VGNTEEARSLLASGHDCLARGDWANARAAFETASSLVATPEALEGLGMAAWWLDDAAALFDARQRAYRLYRQRGDRYGAARVAMMIAVDSLHFRGQTAVARGWHRRAQRLLEGLPLAPEHAWLRLWDGEISLAVDDDGARVRAVAAEASAMGRALGDSDVEMLALAQEGLALVMQGAIEDGMSRLDEAATAALSGDMTNPLAAGVACCHLVEACELVRDIGRAAEWCERVRAYAAGLDFSVLLSVCRTQHAGVLMWSGVWAEAEAELQRAIQHLAGARPGMQEEPLVRLAELRRRQGRFDEALGLLERVDWHPRGRLVRAAIALDSGDPRTALDLARRCLDQVGPSNKIDRALAQELALRAGLALGRQADAGALHDVQELAAGTGIGPLRASARATEALIAAASGRHEEARRAFEEAIGLFARAGAGYETARVRVELAHSLIASGREDAARAELERACRVFEELGAAWDARGTRAALEKVGGRRTSPDGLSAREVEVLRLVAQGLRNQEIGERLGVSPFTVKRHVANILTKLDLPTRAAAAAYAARERWR
jgi:DNA-binding NarL/FixJ family response regulator